jgi:hypothetical protein
MKIFDKILGKPHQPEDDYMVTITDKSIMVEHPKRETESIKWDDINIILIVNTDQGPWAPDVWLTLIGNKSRCSIPQGAKGFEEVYDIVSKYNGFNFENFIKSMSCTDNAEFLLWTNTK